MSYHTRSRNRTRQRTQRTNQTRDNQQRGQTSTPNRTAGSASSLPIVEAPVQIVDNTVRTTSTSTRSITPIGDRKKIVGKNGVTLGMTTFGKSGPYKEVYKLFNLTSDEVVKIVSKNV